MIRNTRVKFCGMTRVSDVLYAVELGVDAIGVIFYESSPRSVSLGEASRIFDVLPPFIARVGVFVDPQPALVRQAIDQTGVNLLQFHGNESETFCCSFGLPYIKVIFVEQVIDMEQWEKNYPGASAFLLDSYDRKKIGGTGKQFNWDFIPSECKKPLILAGGLNNLNLTDLLHHGKIYAFDVSSGIELSAGIKSQEKMKQFMETVHHVMQP